MAVELEEEAVIEVEAQEEDAQEEDAQEAEGEEEAPAAEEPPEPAVTIQLGDETPEEDKLPAPDWVKNLRKERQTLIRENRELKRKAAMSEQPAPVAIGAKPSIADPGIDYDAEKFEKALLDWNSKKTEADAMEAKAKAARKSEEEAWQGELSAYHGAKAALGLADYEDAEETSLSILSPHQQGIIVHAAAQPAELIYALGKNPDEAKKLAAITDPVKFSFAVAKLEAMKLKVTKKSDAPAPERRISGSARITGGSDAHLEALRKESERTGDVSKVVAYKKALRLKSK